MDDGGRVWHPYFHHSMHGTFRLSSSPLTSFPFWIEPRLTTSHTARTGMVLRRSLRHCMGTAPLWRDLGPRHKGESRGSAEVLRCCQSHGQCCDRHRERNCRQVSTWGVVDLLSCGDAMYTDRHGECVGLQTDESVHEEKMGKGQYNPKTESRQQQVDQRLVQEWERDDDTSLVQLLWSVSKSCGYT